MKTTLFILSTLFICTPTFAQTNLVTNGDFATAQICPPGTFTSDYQCGAPGEGTFGITSNAALVNGPWYGTNRTSDGTNFLVADGGTSPDTRVWIQSVNVVNGQQYTFSAYVKNIVNPGSGAGIDDPVPTVSLRVNGTVVVTSPSLTQGTASSWTAISGTYTATSTGTVTLDVYQNIVSGSYNDIGVDDIVFISTTPTGIFEGNASATTWDIVAAPNPFTQETAITVPTNAPEEIQAELYTPNGLLINRWTFLPTEKLILGKELNTGMYFVKLTQNGVSQTVKVLKQ